MQLPYLSRLAFARVEAMRSASGVAEQRADALAVSHARLGERLLHIRRDVAAGTARIDAIIADARENSRHLVSGGLGKGPQQQRDISKVVTPAPGLTRAQIASPAADHASQPPVAAAAPVSPPPPRGAVQERLRQLVRARKPDETMELLPPPRERSPASPDALLLVAALLEMLRVKVRRREKPVRRALRARALARLKRLDIPVGMDADGNYTLAKGMLLDEEMQALTDPALHQKTQRFLAAIARRQQQRNQSMPVQAVPVQAASKGTAGPGLDLATLAAAAARKSKGVGD